MIKLFLVLPVFLYVLSAQAILRFGGDDVGNGGGIAEKNLLTAYANLDRYATLCLDLDSCRLTNKERKILIAIVKAMPKERRRPEMIIFGSEKRSPGDFIIDGEVRVARTGSDIGVPVFINTDLLYSRNSLKAFESVSLAQSVAILIHEFGHHVSKASHAELDLLGVKVSLVLQNQIQSTPVLPWSQSISATVIQGPSVETFPQILLTVGDEVWDLSQAFTEAVFCPLFTVAIPLLPFPDLQLGKKKPLGVIYHNVHWEKAETEDLDGDFRILGNVTHVCPTDSMKLSLVNSFRVRIGFSTKEKEGAPVLDQDSVKVSQSYEPWYKFVMFSF